MKVIYDISDKPEKPFSVEVLYKNGKLIEYSNATIFRLLHDERGTIEFVCNNGLSFGHIDINDVSSICYSNVEGYDLGT